MKLTKIFAVMATLLAVVACNPNKGGNNGGNSGGNTNETWSNSGSIVGEWVLTEWNGSNNLPFGIYLQLNEDKSFDLYQHTKDVLWIHFTGTFSLNGNTLSGEYSDGNPWMEYTVQYNNNAEPKQIKLTRKDSSEDVGIYTATTIPDMVIDQANEAVEVRSVAIERFL